MNDINEFDKIIKEKMEGINEMPPSHLWANISAGIVPKAAIIPFYQHNYFKISILIASIVVVLGISWFTPQNNNNSSNIEIIQNTKNEINNSTTTVKNINIENNNSENIEVITSNNKKLKETIGKETFVENTINNTKKELKPIVVKLADVNNSNDSQKQTMPNIVPVSIAANNSTQNNITKTSLSQERNVEKNGAIVEINNDELQNISTENKPNNSSKKIAVVAIGTPNEVVKEVIIPENNEEIIAKTTTTNKVISQEEPQETIQALIEKPEVEVGEAKKDVDTENSNETIAAKDITKMPDDKMPKSNFNPKSIVYDQYSIGAHYGYEQINTGDLQLASNNFDLSFNFQNVNFIAQTGIGFQISKDKNSYTQYYTRNEYLATQVRFDSIVFVDNGNSGITPVPVNPYYTDIYDSINHTFKDETIETYYSIRIPLMVGYKKSLKYFDVFAQGGIIYSHIFKNHTGAMNQLDNESRMLESEYLINERQNNQFQYVAAVGLSYRITKRLYFNAELMAKYYHYSLYKNTQNNANTWSYEARIGVTYLLN